VTEVDAAGHTDHVQFGLVELDLLATYAGAQIPFPLQVPSFGRVPPERDLLFATAGETLQLRGLADEDGPLDLADELASLLANRTGTIDLVIGGQGWQSGAVALVDTTSAVLCLQRFNEDLVEAYKVPTDSLAAELVRLVPEWSGGHSIPVRLPLRAVRAAQAVLSEAEQDASENTDPEAVEQRLRAAFREHGVDGAAASKLVSVLHPLELYGQMGVTRPGAGGEDVRLGAELSWIDTPRGRYSVASTSSGSGSGSRFSSGLRPGEGGSNGEDGDGWVSINPLHSDELLGVVRGFVSTARR
jgi:EspG family